MSDYLHTDCERFDARMFTARLVMRWWQTPPADPNPFPKFRLFRG